MEKALVVEQYNQHKDTYRELQTRVRRFVENILERHDHIHVASVSTRSGGAIKSIKSIVDNIDNPEKYHGYIDIFDIKDIAAIRVVCHCEDDLENAATLLELELKKKFIDVEREEKGGNNNHGKSQPAYRAIHLNFREKKIRCEVQLRTVMADAWAIQDRKYVYGNVREGEATSLTSAVADIMKGCDMLWTLVKNKNREETKNDQYYSNLITVKPNPFFKQVEKENHHEWFASRASAAHDGFSQLNLVGFMEIEAEPLTSTIRKSILDLKNAAKDSIVRTFGWPIAPFFEDGPSDFAPKPDNDGIKAEIKLKRDNWLENKTYSSYDYWAINTASCFYFLGSLFEDGRDKNKLFFNTRIIRITEALMYIKNLYTNLGIDHAGPIRIKILHHGLSGRILSSATTGRILSFEYKTNTNDSENEIVTSINEINSSMTSLVEAFTEKIFEQFDFFKLGRPVLDEIVQNYINGKIV